MLDRKSLKKKRRSKKPIDWSPRMPKTQIQKDLWAAATPFCPINGQ